MLVDACVAEEDTREACARSMTQGALCPIAGRASPLIRVWNVFVAAGYGFEFCDFFLSVSHQQLVFGLFQPPNFGDLFSCSSALETD